jgi:hypothetical protein
MNENHSRAIIFLLAAILAVMLFGAKPVLTTFGWGVAASVAAALIYFVLVVVVAAIAVKIVEIAEKVPKFLKRWLWCLKAPVLGPAKEWQIIKEQRAQGIRIGYAVFALVGSFIGSMIVWWLAVALPVVLAVAIASEVMSGSR